MSLSKQQELIVNAKEPHIVVCASAASGKSAILVARIQRLINEGIEPKKIVALTFTNAAAENILDRLVNAKGIFVGTIHSYVNFLLMCGGIDTSDILENEQFDRLFDRISKHRECVQPVDYLLLDEAQDSTEEQFQVILEFIKPKNWFLVGDWRQCQPKGTKIYLRDNIVKNIEDVKVGDSVLYYVPGDGRCCGMSSKLHNSLNKKIEKIEHHITSEPIITITTENGKTSSYTPEHRTYVRFHNDGSKHAVYLMCDNNYKFRVGKITLGTEAKNKHNSWRTKMVNEGCEKIWLIKIFDSDHEARVEEARISYFYGIPQICWQTDKTKWTEEEIDYIYKDIPICKRAEQCLIDYGHDIRYPFYDSSIDWMANNHFAGNGCILIYAKNLMPNYMSALCYDSSEKSNKNYELITSVIEEKGKETEVYSLQVEGGNYVADGIVTHNCIYGFLNARPDILLELSKRADVRLYSLNENYRNGRKVLDYAKGIIRLAGLSYRDDSVAMREVDGRIIECEYNPDKIAETIKSYGNFGEWFVLTRTNDEIDVMSHALERYGVPFDTFKRSQFNTKELNQKLKEPTVKLLTIHAAKGLEANKVVVIGARFYNLEEKCISYVAATRARDLLVWTRVPTRRRPRTGGVKLNDWE